MQNKEPGLVRNKRQAQGLERGRETSGVLGGKGQKIPLPFQLISIGIGLVQLGGSAYYKCIDGKTMHEGRGGHGGIGHPVRRFCPTFPSSKNS